MEPVWAVGLMTGTVLDGNIDVALLKTDGEMIDAFGDYRLVPYPEEVQAFLVEALAAAQDWNFAARDPEVFRRAEAALTEAQSHAVLGLIDDAGLTPADVRVVGFHGQTMLHRAPAPGKLGATRQLGDGPLMADVVGADVVYDFRSADMAAGGQGAPLSAAYHRALLRHIGAGPETAVLNLGGVANFTWEGRDGMLVAFDTGPANAPINDFIRACGLGEMDRDGAVAARGTVDEARLAARLDDPYFSQPYPKSLDRYGFGFGWVEGLSPADGAATLTAFSAAAVGRGLDLLPERPARVIVCGGGRHNPTLMRELERRAGVRPVLADRFGWRGDAVEAECFAFLAVRALRGLPLSYPTTTGVPAPMTGGVFARPGEQA